MKRKNTIICCSAEDMERKAEGLMMQGYHVEREASIEPVNCVCINTYKVIFWK